MTDSVNNSSSGARSLFADIAKNIKKSRELDRNRLKADISRSGGQQAFLSARYPNLSRLAPNGVLGDLTTRTTLGDLNDAERRCQACATCPPGGGGCSDDHDGHPRGQQPRWQSGQLVFSSCSRWPEYQLQRRVVASGIPERYASVSILDVEERLDEEARKRLKRFLKESIKGSDKSLVVSGNSSNWVAIGIVRAMIRSGYDQAVWFERATTLVRPLKMFFADPKNQIDPLSTLANAQFLVLSGIEAKPGDWFIDALQEVILSRFYAKKQTVLAVKDGVKPLSVSKFYFGENVDICET